MVRAANIVRFVSDIFSRTSSGSLFMLLQNRFQINLPAHIFVIEGLGDLFEPIVLPVFDLLATPFTPSAVEFR